MHRYSIWFGTDGDYVVLEKLNGYWITCTRWMIPGTQLED